MKKPQNTFLFQPKLNPIPTTQTQPNTHHTNSTQYIPHKLISIHTTQTQPNTHHTNDLQPALYYNLIYTHFL